MIRATRPLVVVNPRAGGGRAGERWPVLAREVEAALGPCDVRFTGSVGDGRRLAADGAREGRGLVVAVGGDGTVSEVADGLLSSRTDGAGEPEMGIVPAGTASDLARALGIPREPCTAARRLARGASRRIDAGRIRFVGHDGRPAVRHFVNGASLGISGPVAARANAASKRLGARLSYARAVLRECLRFENVGVRLRADGVDLPERRVMLVTVGNGRFSAGGVVLCPDAVVDDGLLRLCVVGALGRVRRFINVPGAYLGPAFTRAGMELSDVRRLDADADGIVPIEVDGETPGRLPATFEVLPAALTVRC